MSLRSSNRNGTGKRSQKGEAPEQDLLRNGTERLNGTERRNRTERRNCTERHLIMSVLLAVGLDHWINLLVLSISFFIHSKSVSMCDILCSHSSANPRLHISTLQIVHRIGYVVFIGGYVPTS